MPHPFARVWRKDGSEHRILGKNRNSAILTADLSVRCIGCIEGEEPFSPFVPRQGRACLFWGRRELPG